MINEFLALRELLPASVRDLAAQRSHRKIAATTAAASGLVTIPVQKSQVFVCLLAANIAIASDSLSIF